MRLWPVALQHAAYLYNWLPHKGQGTSSLEIYTGNVLDKSTLWNKKVWGCPAYILDPCLQDGKKIPKWYPKTRLVQYMGKYTSHASTVGIIRNLRTGFVSPLFHVVYDNKFQGNRWI